MLVSWASGVGKVGPVTNSIAPMKTKLKRSLRSCPRFPANIPSIRNICIYAFNCRLDPPATLLLPTTSTTSAAKSNMVVKAISSPKVSLAGTMANYPSGLHTHTDTLQTLALLMTKELSQCLLFFIMSFSRS